MMSTKKDIFGNWTEHRMCEDYHPMNKQTHSNKYSMPLLEDFFMPLDNHFFLITWTYNMVNKLPLKENDKVKMALWGIDLHGKDCLYQWKFLSICLKNVFIEF